MHGDRSEHKRTRRTALLFTANNKTQRNRTIYDEMDEDYIYLYLYLEINLYF